MEEKNIKQQYLDFDEYIRQGEPEKKERAEAWRFPSTSPPEVSADSEGTDAVSRTYKAISRA